MLPHHGIQLIPSRSGTDSPINLLEPFSLVFFYDFNYQSSLIEQHNIVFMHQDFKESRCDQCHISRSFATCRHLLPHVLPTYQISTTEHLITSR